MRRSTTEIRQRSAPTDLAIGDRGANQLALTANTPEVGESRETIAVNYKGSDLAIAFNPAYLMDPLRALEEDEVFLELNDELSPGVLKVNGPFLYVVMPMRLS